MPKLILEVEENRYALLLQFLKTLEYVKVVQTTTTYSIAEAALKNIPSESQLFLLQQCLKQQTRAPFQHIVDPVEWQKRERDEWS